MKPHVIEISSDNDSKPLRLESIAQNGAGVAVSIGEEKVVVPCGLLSKAAKLLRSERKLGLAGEVARHNSRGGEICG